MRRLQIHRADITRLEVECIVNAANSRLAGGGGVDGAIHRAAGPRLAEACGKLGGCSTGEVRVTEGFELPARWIIHAVGPVYRDGEHNEAALLAACYRNAFAVVVDKGITSIAFPAISCGVYGFPVKEAAKIAVTETVGFLERDSGLQTVIFCCFQDDVYEAYTDAVEAVYSE